MRKFWLLALALSLGFLVAESRAQYPGQPNNYGPSSYPVSQSIMQAPPQVPNYQAAPQVNTQVPNYRPAPQVNTPRPPSTPFQLTGAQEQIYGAGQQLVQPLQQAAPAPTQMPAQAPNHAPNQVHPGAVHQGAATHNTPLPTLHAPAANYPAAQGPGCSTCGPTGMQSAPTMMPQTINQGYAPTTTVMQGSVPAASCAPTTYGYTQSYVASAPSHNFGDRARNMFGSHSTVSKPWFFGGNVLFLNRSDDKSRPLSFFDSSYTGDVLTTGDARLGVATGIEAFGGRYFNCGRNAIQFSYWGAFPDDQDAIRARTTAGDYRSRNPYQYMTMAGTPSAPTTPYAAYDWYDNAFTHQVSRSAEYHNFEVNLLGFAVGSAARNFNRSTAGSFFSGTRRSSGSHCGYCGGAGCGSCDSSCGSCGTACGGSCGGCSTGSCGTPTKYATGPCNLIAPACGSRLNMTWLAGFRYFRFNDGLLYAASLDDSNINRSADDFYYEVNTQNDLAGVQAGGRLDYCFGKRINVYGFTKAGIYNNQSNLQTRMGTDFDHAYLLDTRTPANPNNNVDYVFDETKNDVAFLTELGAGMGYRVTCKWTATFGYRAVIVNGVATSVDNYRESFANYDDVRNFDNYGSLILHGFNAGATYNF